MLLKEEGCEEEKNIFSDNQQTMTPNKKRRAVVRAKRKRMRQILKIKKCSSRK